MTNTFDLNTWSAQDIQHSANLAEEINNIADDLWYVSCRARRLLHQFGGEFPVMPTHDGRVETIGMGCPLTMEQLRDLIERNISAFGSIAHAASKRSEEVGLLAVRVEHEKQNAA